MVAQAQVGLGQGAEALKALEPAPAHYRNLRIQGATHLAFHQHFARVLYAKVLAEPPDADGTTKRRKALAEVTRVFNKLAAEAGVLHDSKEVMSWIPTAQKEPNPQSENQRP